MSEMAERFAAARRTRWDFLAKLSEMRKVQPNPETVWAAAGLSERDGQDADEVVRRLNELGLVNGTRCGGPRGPLARLILVDGVDAKVERYLCGEDPAVLEAECEGRPAPGVQISGSGHRVALQQHSAGAQMEGGR